MTQELMTPCVVMSCTAKQSPTSPAEDHTTLRVMTNYTDERKFTTSNPVDLAIVCVVTSLKQQSSVRDTPNQIKPHLQTVLPQPSNRS